MKPNSFEEGQVWGNRYGGSPLMNAHYRVQRIDGDLHLVSAHNKVKVEGTTPDSSTIYLCGTYDEVFWAPIFEKEATNE